VRTVFLFFSILLTGFPAVTVAQSGPPPMSSDGQAACVVVDPTSTPLNVRTAPYGQIVGTVPNGRPVRILNQANDPRGKPWANIADTNSRPLGWVFREYLVCR
jgi:hypothetical protein